MKRYICGLCKGKGKEFVSTRKALREHLQKEHKIKHELTNFGAKKSKQTWWITEEI
jgi:hypothetical protein